MGQDPENSELQELIEQKLRQKKQEWREEFREDLKKEAKQEAKEELREEITREIAENARKETGNANMSRRQFLKKAGLGAAGLGALGLAPAASQLKLTKNGIFPSSGSTSIDGDLNMEGKNIKNANQLSSNSISTDKINGAFNSIVATLSSNQSFGGGSRAKIQFDTLDVSEDNGFSTSTYDYTAPRDGLYLAAVYLAADTTDTSDPGNAESIIYKNGAEFITPNYNALEGTNLYPSIPMRPIRLNSGDTISIRFEHNLGGGQTVTIKGQSYWSIVSI